MEKFGDFIREKCLDFAVAKIYISLKECAETGYWLKILFRTNYITRNEYDDINGKCQELNKIFNSMTKKLWQQKLNN